MSMKTKYILVVTVAWLVVAGLIIIPKLIFKQPISTNTTLTDVVNAIYNTHSSLQNTIYVAVGILLAVMLSRK